MYTVIQEIVNSTMESVWRISISLHTGNRVNVALRRKVQYWNTYRRYAISILSRIDVT